MHIVTKQFIGGLLKGLTIKERYKQTPPKVGFVCLRPIGGSSYHVVSVIKVS